MLIERAVLAVAGEGSAARQLAVVRDDRDAAVS